MAEELFIPLPNFYLNIPNFTVKNLFTPNFHLNIPLVTKSAGVVSRETKKFISNETKARTCFRICSLYFSDLNLIWAEISTCHPGT